MLIFSLAAGPIVALAFWQELVKEAVGAAATALLVTVAGGILVARWSTRREEKRELFELRRELLKRCHQTGNAFWIQLQHAARVAGNKRSRRSGALWDRLDNSYHQFVVDIRSLENEVGSRYGFGTSLATGERQGPQAYERCHQVRDLLTMYYFNLRARWVDHAFPRGVIGGNSLDHGRAYHAGLNFGDYDSARPALAKMRDDIRSEYNVAMRELTRALLSDPAKTGS